MTAYDKDTTQPTAMQRTFIEAALVAHRSYFERARVLLRQARTADEITSACGFMQSAAGEITRWQAALEACDG